MAKVLKKRKLDGDAVFKPELKLNVEAVLKLHEATSAKNVLFEDETPIFAQITVIKVPKCPSRILRIPLAYPLSNDNAQIALITKDILGEEDDFENNIEVHTELLSNKGVTTSPTIIPFKQVCKEYRDYEMQRRLVGLYDVFLIDARVRGHFAKRFQKVFLKSRKFPTSIKMQASNLKSQFDKALLKTEMKLHSHGNTFTVQVGHTKMSKEQLKENVEALFDGLEDQFPGGIDNIRSIHLKTDKGTAVPIYVSFKHNSEVEVPVVYAKRPKTYRPIMGECSTAEKNVIVMPTGDVIVENDNGFELAVKPKKIKKTIKVTKKVGKKKAK